MRVHRECTGNGHALLLATGKLARLVVDALGKPHLRELLNRDLGRFLFGALEHLLLREHDVALGSEVREQVEALEHHADLRAHSVDIGALGGNLGVLEKHLAARGLLEQVHAAQERGFAGTRRP